MSSVPATPRVISPSPTPSESGAAHDGYFTRSTAKRRVGTSDTISEDLDDEEEDSAAIDARRPRSISREPLRQRRADVRAPKSNDEALAPLTLTTKEPNGAANGTANSHLSPVSAQKSGGWSWRDFSRSPSPLGLIPIHRHWRTFVHKHEVPRKMLHVSIGFFSLYAYLRGVQTTAITPWLMSALIPIAIVDLVRHRNASFNRLYAKVMGAFMREKEYDGYNGVIWYLLGVWIVLGFFAKDIGMMGVLLLSWCDTAASTVGRAYGRYTPRLRRGKSLAGSLAALLVGVLTALMFWGIAPAYAIPGADDGWPFMFQGTLSLPAPLQDVIGLSKAQATISGRLALAVMSTVTGVIASGSEVVDIYGWDDNLTIPVLSGIGLWAFLKIFG